MSRPRTSIVYLCLAVVVLAAFLPGVSPLDDAVPMPQGVLLPDLSIVTLDLATTFSEDQPVSLLSLTSPRAPPRLPFASLPIT